MGHGGYCRNLERVLCGGGVGDEPDCSQSHGQAGAGEERGQAVVEERKEDGNQSGQEAGEGGGESHGAHRQGAVEDGQGNGAFKSADGGEEQIVAAGEGAMGSDTNGEEHEQRDQMIGGDYKQCGSAARAQAANEVGTAPTSGGEKAESGGCSGGIHPA